MSSSAHLLEVVDGDGPLCRKEITFLQPLLRCSYLFFARYRLQLTGRHACDAGCRLNGAAS